MIKLCFTHTEICPHTHRQPDGQPDGQRALHTESQRPIHPPIQYIGHTLTHIYTHTHTHTTHKYTPSRLHMRRACGWLLDQAATLPPRQPSFSSFVRSFVGSSAPPATGFLPPCTRALGGWDGGWVSGRDDPHTYTHTHGHDTIRPQAD